MWHDSARADYGLHTLCKCVYIVWSANTQTPNHFSLGLNGLRQTNKRIRLPKMAFATAHKSSCIPLDFQEKFPIFQWNFAKIPNCSAFVLCLVDRIVIFDSQNPGDHFLFRESSSTLYAHTATCMRCNFHPLLALNGKIKKINWSKRIAWVVCLSSDTKQYQQQQQQPAKSCATSCKRKRQRRC